MRSFPQNIRIRSNCLSVKSRTRTSPSFGTHRSTRLICTVEFSSLGQHRAYTEYCNIVNPSESKSLRNLVYAWRACFVSTGKSNITMTHIHRYPLSCIIQSNLSTRTHAKMSIPNVQGSTVAGYHYDNILQAMQRTDEYNTINGPVSVPIFTSSAKSLSNLAFDSFCSSTWP